MDQTDKKSQDKKSLIQRAWVSLIAIPLVVVIIWFGAPWFTLLVVFWCMGSVHEFYTHIKKSKKFSPLVIFGMIWVGLLVASPHIKSLPQFADISPAAFLLTAGVVISLLVILWSKGKENAFANWSWTVAGVLYIGWLSSLMVALRNLDDGRGWVFLAVLCTFASDSMAYLAGRALGKHRLAPYVSPKKTWEGAVAGGAGAIVASTLIVWFFNLPVAYWQVIILGFAISLFGQLGDLVKSLFKRNMEVKDSGNILPGHGGFLDRIDSMIFAGVVTYFFAVFIQG
ncbi:MAG TPA: phosphatidate cytidylyltransferase [Dehalococcoidales bacterium]|nr:phosphatidate cytidylyltransferase [Dehalococcoidales bacterium]